MLEVPRQLQDKQNGAMAWILGSSKRELLPNVLGNLHVNVGNDPKRQRGLPGTSR
jgi:hypothetical protein